MTSNLHRPMPSAAMQAVLDRLTLEDGDLGDPTLLPPAEGRALAAHANLRWNTDLPLMEHAETIALCDDTARLLTPAAAGPGLILYIHGGGWAFCNTDTHERAARVLAIEAGVSVVTFNYRLAPEHPYPAGLNDCIAIWRQIATMGALHQHGPIALAGDSAGANLALAVMLHEVMSGNRLPDCGLLFYGVFGSDFDSPSYRNCASGPGLTREKMQRYWDWYAPKGVRRHNPLVAPLAADDAMLRALPPLYLNAAEVDPLRSDSAALHARLRALGHGDRLDIIPGVVHGFMQMTHSLAAARAAFAKAGAAFRQMAGLPSKTEFTLGGDPLCAHRSHAI